MKNIVSKRLIAVALVLVLALSMIIPAMAAGENGYTVNIVPASGSAKGEDYTDRFEAYQIFSGEPYFGSAEPTGIQDIPASAQLVDLKWGSCIDSAKFAAALFSASNEDGNTLKGVFDALKDYAGKYGSDECAQAVASALSGKSTAQVSAFAKLAQANLKENLEDEKVVSAWNEENNNWKIEVGNGGYYLIVDKLNDSDAYDSNSSYIMGVFGDETVKIKSSIPEVEKVIVTDTENDTTAKGTTSEVGDKVTFRLTATLPENYAEYTSYMLSFVDKMSAGLTYDKDSVKLYAAKSAITSGYTASEKDGTLTVTVDDLKTVKTIDKDTQIVVEYTATLNSAAVAGTADTNEVYLVYSNDPNNSDSTGKTTEKKVFVYDFALDITKIGDKDGTQVYLGAGFAVMNGNGEYGLFTLADGKYTLAGWIAEDALDISNGWTAAVKNPGDPEGTYYVAFMTDVENEGKLSLSGFAEGTYTLKEVVTPAGYNSIEPIEIEIKAELAESGALTKVEGKKANNVGGVTVDKTEEGVIYVTVLNVSASALPGTGGIGITVFYMIGIILLVSAGIMLVRKKSVQ